jgi:xanthosine utilization system XapX-like protein
LVQYLKKHFVHNIKGYQYNGVPLLFGGDLMSKGFKLLSHFITFITGAILVNWLLYLSAGWKLPNTEVIHFALVSIASPLAQVLIAVSAIGFLVGHGSIEVYKAKQLLKKECALQERHLAKKFISDLSELKNRLETLNNYLALSGSNKLIGYIKDNTENTAREYKGF